MSSPTFVKLESAHPLSQSLLTKPRDPQAGLNPIKPAIRPGDPQYADIAGGVADLEAAFASSITPTEIAWAQGKVPPSIDRPEPPPQLPSGPQKFKNAYHAIIDQLLIDPTISVTRLATVTGYSRTWLHKVMSSDSFQSQLATRQKNLVDDHIRNTVMDRLSGLGSRAIEILETALDSEKVPAEFALEVLNMANKAQGIGQQKVQNTQNFIVQVPVPMTNAADWAAQHNPSTPQATVGSALNDQDRAAIHQIMTPGVVEPMDMGPAEVVQDDAVEGGGLGATEEGEE